MMDAEKIAEYWNKQAQADSQAASSFLAETLGYPEYRCDARSAIQLDYATYLLEFCKGMVWGPQRTLSLYGLGIELLQLAQANQPFSEAQALLKARLTQLCRANPAPDSAHMTPAHISAAAQFFARTLLQHYRLYCYVFSAPQGHTQYAQQLQVQTACPLPPLEAAFPEAEWKVYVEGEAAKKEAEIRAAEEAERARVEAERKVREEAVRAEEEERRRQELAKKPATLEEAIDHMVAVRLEEEKKILLEKYKPKETPPRTPEPEPAPAPPTKGKR